MRRKKNAKKTASNIIPASTVYNAESVLCDVLNVSEYYTSKREKSVCILSLFHSLFRICWLFLFLFCRRWWRWLVVFGCSSPFIQFAFVQHVHTSIESLALSSFVAFIPSSACCVLSIRMKLISKLPHTNIYTAYSVRCLHKKDLNLLVKYTKSR